MDRSVEKIVEKLPQYFDVDFYSVIWNKIMLNSKMKGLHDK